MASKIGPRKVLNRYYLSLGDEAKYRFLVRYGRIFWGDNVRLAAGEWEISFTNFTIRLPLRPSWSWLDWAHAVSIVGHDIEVKQTYAALISSSDQRPSLFLDVGANGGTHSALFLAAGIAAIAFEPNPSCFSYFQAICELNGFRGAWEEVAIGNSAGWIELTYPERETWLGSASPRPMLSLKERGDVVTKRVPVRRLDDYLVNIPADSKILIKIDVEGYESEVLQGASQLLRDFHPKIIFESNDVGTRADLFRQLSRAGYFIHHVPWLPNAASPMNLTEFSTSTATNFMAIAGASSGN
jgi:FkbM family methyltransferase